MDHLDTIVIGAGAVGLAIARELAMAGRDVAVVEAEGRIGSITSARNSGVIHAGLYYPEGSLKARLCVEGKALLYAYARARAVPFANTGKIIVARDESELGMLDRIRAAAARNGVTDLKPLSAADLKMLEPELAGFAGLMSPSTGIIDAPAYLDALLADAEEAGAMLVLGSRVTALRPLADGIVVSIDSGPDRYEVLARAVVNAAGLGAQAVAHTCAGIRTGSIPPLHLAKGCYFRLTGKAPFSHLIYPVPVPGGLGTHLTLDLAGDARFGPNVIWTDRVEYDVDPALEADFRREIAGYYPGIESRGLSPDFAGMRPKVTGPGEAAGDFMLQDTAIHGVPGLVNLFGIESPGLTASLAIARHVAALVRA